MSVLPSSFVLRDPIERAQARIQSACVVRRSQPCEWLQQTSNRCYYTPHVCSSLAHIASRHCRLVERQTDL